MNRKKVFYSVLIVSCILLFFIYIVGSKSAVRVTTSNVPNTNGEITLSVKTIEETEETKRSSVKISIPEISGLKPAIIETTINEKIREFANKTKVDFINEVEGFEIVLPDQKHQLIISGSLVQNPTLSKGLIGIEVEVYTFYSGAAHPFAHRKIFNFLAQTGQTVRIEDILKPNNLDQKIISAKDQDFSSSLTELSKIVKPKILKKMSQMINENNLNSDIDTEVPKAEDSFFSEGVDPKLENFDTFFIRHNGIEFVFDQYQVAPYAFGEISVLVEWSEIERILIKKSYLPN